jgi:hypothetical protein
MITKMDILIIASLVLMNIMNAYTLYSGLKEYKRQRGRYPWVLRKRIRRSLNVVERRRQRRYARYINLVKAYHSECPTRT